MLLPETGQCPAPAARCASCFSFPDRAIMPWASNQHWGVCHPHPRPATFSAVLKSLCDLAASRVHKLTPAVVAVLIRDTKVPLPCPPLPPLLSSRILSRPVLSWPLPCPSPPSRPVPSRPGPSHPVLSPRSRPLHSPALPCSPFPLPCPPLPLPSLPTRSLAACLHFLSQCHMDVQRWHSSTVELE